MHQGDRHQGAAGSGSGGVPGELPGGVPAAGASFAERLAVVDAASEALTGLVEVVHRCQGSDLGPAMGRLDVLRRLVEAAQVAVLAEALERGEVASSTWSNGGGLGAGVGAVVPFRWGG